jgi:GNAT superfamily N-acetyltransferase
MDIAIRRATEEDLPDVLMLVSQLGMDDGSTLSLEEACVMMRRMQFYPDYALYVACAGDRIAGMFALLVMDNIGHCGAPSAIVEDVIVDEELRGAGIGRRMMQAALEMCREKGCYKMTLSSNRNREAARRFYQALGFEVHGLSFVCEPASAFSVRKKSG